MAGARRTSQTLMAAMTNVLSQSERLARAEARAVASRVGDLAQEGAGRAVLVVTAGMLATLGVGFLLLAAYDAMSARLPRWEAALVVAGGSLVLAALVGWKAFSRPLAAAPLLPTLTTRGES